MTSLRFLSPIRSLVVAGAVSLLAAGVAQAQVSSTASSSSEFSSSSLNYSFLPDSPDAAAEPTAPAVGGQYDNRGGGGGGYHNHGGIFSHLTWEAGGGFNAPAGDSGSYITWGGNFTVGGGVKLSDHIKVLAEYQFMDDKLPGAIINEAGAEGGHAHIWSLTLNPVFDLMPKKTNSVYITGGGGFFRKVTSFTDPEETEYCYYFCGIGYENAVVGHFSSNQGGWSVGGGYTHKLGGVYGDGKTQLFAEARFLWINTPAVYGLTPNGLGATTVASDTKLVPVTFGLRF